MDLSSAVYAYQYSNVAALASLDAATVATCVAFLVLAATSIMAGPYVYGFTVYRQKELEKLEKKKTIKNLLVMKDIQTELEEEMKRSLTNANMN